MIKRILAFLLIKLAFRICRDIQAANQVHLNWNFIRHPYSVVTNCTFSPSASVPEWADQSMWDAASDEALSLTD